MQAQSLVLTLLSYFASSYCQKIIQGYPFGSETSWTRYSWPALRLDFPYEQYFSQEDIGILSSHSSSGPRSIQHYRKAADQQRSRQHLKERKLNAEEKAVTRCTTCNILLNTVWEVAREDLHTTSRTPSLQHLTKMLHDSCQSQTPEIMQVLSQLTKKLSGVRGKEASSDMSTARLRGLCKSILEVSANGESDVAITMLKGLQKYAAKVNGMTYPTLKNSHFDKEPIHGTCQDFHAECSKWAAAGECIRNPDYMIGDESETWGHCMASCGTCLAPLLSGDTPEGKSYLGLGKEFLDQVQLNGCNTSGICDGVDANRIPKISSIRLEQADSHSSVRAALQDLVLDKPVETAARAPATFNPGSDGLEQLKTAAELLPSSDCIRTNTGWWTYELCPRLHIHQYRVDPETEAVLQTISLGSYSTFGQPEQTKDQVLHSPLATGSFAAPRYYVKSMYREGSRCLLDDKVTETARETEVRMACSLDGKVYLSVAEPEQCKYIVLLRTPDLCIDQQGPQLWKLEPIAPHNQEEL